jgi:hypothetical protein
MLLSQILADSTRLYGVTPLDIILLMKKSSFHRYVALHGMAARCDLACSQRAPCEL